MNDEYRKFIPLDKSWINRMGVLDMIYGYKDIQDFLNKEKNLGDDLQALMRAASIWDTDKPIDVGESGTLYRILQFVSWKMGLNKKFITRGTLIDRLKKMPNDPNIVNLNLKELRALPDNTSQRVTAAILLGNTESIPEDFDYEIKYTTVEALAHWKKQREAGLIWKPRYDETIQKQVEAFLDLSQGLKPNFTPQHSEDYCFARVFGYMSKEEGEKKWPKLHGHESDRLKGMEEAIFQVEKGELIDSPDHRVVQAMAMWGKVNHKELEFTEKARHSVAKSWPLFWEFLEDVIKK